MDSTEIEAPLHGDLLSHTVVTLHDEYYKAFLLMFTDKIEFIALKLDQTDRIRRYSWKYEQIKKVVQANIHDKKVIYIYTTDQSGICDSFEVVFSNEIERNSYALRINSLVKLYNTTELTERAGSALGNTGPEKSSPVSHCGNNFVKPCEPGSDDDVSKKLESMQISTPSKSKVLDHKVELTDGIGLNMFSPDNLKKYKNLSQDSLIESIPELAQTSLLPEDNPSISAQGQLDSEGHVLIPIEIDVPDLNSTLKAAAKMKLQLSLDAEALDMASRIADRGERIEKIRDLFKMDASLCELVLQ